jgi:hypothetical protein
MERPFILEHSTQSIFRFFQRTFPSTCVHNILNLLLVVLGIRTGAILMVTNDKFDKFEEVFNFPMIYGKRHSTIGNYIICNKDDSERVEKIDRISLLNLHPADHTEEFDVLTGEVLGYFTPLFLDIKEPGQYVCRITIKLSSLRELSFFPQKVIGDFKPEYEQTLKDMVKKIKEIEENDPLLLRSIGIHIIDVNYFIEEVVKKGGKTKRKRKTKRK